MQNRTRCYIDARMATGSKSERMMEFAKSEYAQHWGALLRNQQLRAMASRNGQRLVFMPHPNAEPYIEAFDPPPDVQVVKMSSGVVQQQFASSAGFITDYTSVAFTMALLRRPVFYYQFDRDRFYSGDHNWRIGYFDYDRDGFGPVALTEVELLMNLGRYFANQAQPEPEYLQRMEHAMPEVDAQSCRKLFERILELRHPFKS